MVFRPDLCLKGLKSVQLMSSLSISTKIVSEYDQEIPQSQATDKPISQGP